MYLQYANFFIQYANIFILNNIIMRLEKYNCNKYMKFYEFTVSKMVYLDINVHKTIVEEKKFIMSQSMFFRENSPFGV